MSLRYGGRRHLVGGFGAHREVILDLHLKIHRGGSGDGKSNRRRNDRSLQPSRGEAIKE